MANGCIVACESTEVNWRLYWTDQCVNSTLVTIILLDCVRRLLGTLNAKLKVPRIQSSGRPSKPLPSYVPWHGMRPSFSSPHWPFSQSTMDNLQVQLDTPAQLIFERSFYIGSYITAILYGSEKIVIRSPSEPHVFVFCRDAALHVLFIQLPPPELFARRCSKGEFVLHHLQYYHAASLDGRVKFQCFVRSVHLG
jgi:hypothetical protein